MRAKFNLEHPTDSTDTAQKTVQSLYKKTPKTPIVLPKLSANTRIFGLIALAAIVLLGIGFRVVSQFPKSSDITVPSAVQTPAPLSKEAVNDLVEKVQKHMVLPPETPQVVAITNVDSLKKQQAFFTLAQNGDQLLVYPSKVILYRPSTDQVVDVAQIRLSPTPASASPSAGL